MMLLFLSSLITATPPDLAPVPAKICNLDENGWCTDKVVRLPLQFEDLDPSIKINCALGIGTSIELPRHVGLKGEPVLSNDGVLHTPKNDRRLEELGVFEVLPRIRAGKGVNSEELLDRLVGSTAGTVKLAFEVGVTLIIRLRIVGDRDEHAVERLVIEFPEAVEKKAWAVKQYEKLAQKLQKKTQEREAQLDEEAKVLGYRAFVAGRLERNQCRDIGKVGEHRLGLVLAKRFCQVGDRMLVDFEIINRSARASFIVGNVAVYVQGKPADADYVLKGGTSSAEIPFGKSGVLGTAWWTATETTVFDLLVEEHGGQGRKVWVRNLTF